MRTNLLSLPESLRYLLRILRLGKIKKTFFVFGMLFVFLTMFSEGVVYGLLYPLFKKLVEGQEFVAWKQMPIVGTVLSRFGFENIVRSIPSIILFIFVCAAMRILSMYLSFLFTKREGLRVKKNLRVLLYRFFLGLGNTFFDQKRTGEIYEIVITSTHRVEESIVQLQQVILYFLVSFVYAVLLFLISWQMTLLIFVMLPLLFFVMKRLSLKLEAISNKVLKVTLDTAGLGVDVFANIKLVKSFCTEAKESEKFEKLERFNEIETLRLNAIRQSIFPLHELVVTMAICCLFIITLLWLGYRGSPLLIKLSLVTLLMKRFSATVSGFNSAVASFSESLPHAKTILETLNTKDKPVITGGTFCFNGIEKGLGVKNVSMGYVKDKTVLKNISFFMPKGTTYAIVGASGAGKTTLVELLPRFYDFQEGSIEIDGIDIRNFDLRQLRQNISMVTQETIALNDTIYNNLVYGNDNAVMSDVVGAVKKARLEGFINNLPQKYDTNIGDKGVKLSGGELQRLSIARAILKNAPILILDEATSSIDSISERLIQGALYDLSKDRTVLVIAHRLSTIMNANQIIVLEEGRIVESGKLQELIDKKAYFCKYWEAQKF